jgi:hypothetical protein
VRVVPALVTGALVVAGLIALLADVAYARLRREQRGGVDPA